jgi:Protein of unknown function (DUF3038)
VDNFILAIMTTKPWQPYPIKAHLDLILLALEALTGVGSDGVLQVAHSLGLQDLLSDRVTLWRLRQSSPLRKSKGGRKRLELDEARALVLVSCQLALQHESAIRQAIAYLETCKNHKKALHRSPILAEYLERFSEFYVERIASEGIEVQNYENLALKLLVDLLFYSAPSGAKRLWLVLLEQDL